MTYADAIGFLYHLRWFGAKFGLDNTVKLAALAGNPHQALRFIHVAGTNGKGSTCAMLESIYRAAGLRVGLFTSPHLVAFSERIQVDRRPIPEGEVAGLVAEMRGWLREGWESAEAGAPRYSSARILEPGGAGMESSRSGAPRSGGEVHPTFFEVVTVMALRYFAEQKCDLVVWETGLGGRLDATNIVTPLVSLITNIQYDHQKWLGETLASIAGEKAGIIKAGVPVITATDAPEALHVIAESARQQSAPLTIVAASEMQQPPLDTIALPLLGRHQRMNAAVALDAVRALAPQIPVREEAIRAGLLGVRWAGRLQLVTRPSGQRILLDGAHNVGGAHTLVAALEEYFPRTERTLVLGILQDKDWPRICEVLAPLARRILVVPVSNERTAAPEQLQAACARANPTGETVVCRSLGEALKLAEEEPFVVVTGSLYLIGEALELLHAGVEGALGERGLNDWTAPPAR